MRRNLNNNIMDYRKSLLFIPFITVFLLSPACSKDFNNSVIGVISRWNDYYSTHVIVPELCGDWVAEDGSHVAFYSNGEVEFFDFIQYKDSFIKQLTHEEIDSLRQVGHHVRSNVIEVNDTIHYAKGTWSWFLGDIECRSECMHLGRWWTGVISIHYQRRLLPPYKMLYIYDIIGDPDNGNFHKLYKVEN